MLHRLKRGFGAFFITCLLVASQQTAFAGPLTYGFTQISSNGSPLTASQYSVAVEAYGEGQALFTFTNTAAIASTITGVYFQDGTLLGIGSLIEDGVHFSVGGTPGDLPGGNSLNPDFKVTAGFLVHSDKPKPHNGINESTDSLGVIFNLKTGKTFDDVVAALTNGHASPNDVWKANGADKVGGLEGLRIGLHVQSINGGGSESFVSVPILDIPQAPEPASITLAACGAVCLVARYGWRRRKPISA
jgi:hypothetical protein